MTNLRLPGQYDERLLGSLGLQGPYYSWNRWYLPGAERYLGPDPLATKGDINGFGAPNRYNYVLGNLLADVQFRLGRVNEAQACLGRAETLAQSTGSDEDLLVLAATRARWTGTGGKG